jgi:hypothetical protein
VEPEGGSRGGSLGELGDGKRGASRTGDVMGGASRGEEAGEHGGLASLGSPGRTVEVEDLGLRVKGLKLRLQGLDFRV